jgi:hypothetical protein
VSFPVVARCRYLAQVEDEWEQDHWDANRVIKALKRESFKGFARPQGWRHREPLKQECSHLIDDWFGAWAAGVLADRGLEYAILVGVPSSNVISKDQDDYTACRMIRAIQQQYEKGHAPKRLKGPCWRETMTPTHTGGPRLRVDEYFERLTKLKFNSNPDAVIIDDVRTSGARLRSVAGRLEEGGCTVKAAIVAARTTYNVDEAVWDVPDEEMTPYLEDWSRTPFA